MIEFRSGPSYVPRTRYCETMGRFFLMLWPDIIQFGRITSDVITGMSVRGLNWGWARSDTNTANMAKNYIL